MRKPLNLTGKKFSRLTALSITKERVRGSAVWIWLCDCGTKKKISSSDVVRLKTKSCGCAINDGVKSGAIKRSTHGLSKSSIHQCWRNMKQRCFNSKHPEYKNYGARGIKVCNEWLIFENFLKDMGEPRDGETIERIDVNKNYSKSNCEWATIKKQNKNKRNTVFLTIEGIRRPMVDWARNRSHYSCMQERKKAGLSDLEVLFGKRGIK